MDKIIYFIQNANTNLWLFFLIFLVFISTVGIAWHLCYISKQLDRLSHSQPLQTTTKSSTIAKTVHSG
jgi:hypothetical protein